MVMFLPTARAAKSFCMTESAEVIGFHLYKTEVPKGRIELVQVEIGLRLLLDWNR